MSRAPILRQVLLWSIPALILGAALRLCLLSYAPYAFWESDSNSYFGFAHQLFYHGDFSIDSKRRYLYPVFVGLLNVLPGSVMGWLALTQHLLGLAGVLSLGYVVRQTCVAWRWWIVPVTVGFATLPVVVWFEHAALGETLFISCLTLSLGGWTAWVTERREGRDGRGRWWWFFVPFAIALLTKSAGRFVWPGFALAVLVLGARRYLGRTQTISLLALFLLSLTAGSGAQGSWMLYASSLPLTRLDTPKHAEYKAELRPIVEKARAEIDTFYANDDATKRLVRDPDTARDLKLWHALSEGKNRKMKLKLYRDLALEGILHEPRLMAYISLERLVASSNTSQFKERRFEGDYAGRSLSEAFGAEHPPDENVMRLVLGLPRDAPIPPGPEIARKMSPHPDSAAARFMIAYTLFHDRLSEIFTPNEVFNRKMPIWNARPTFLGIWLMVGLLVAVLMPAYRAVLGVWTLVVFSYLFGTYAVGSANPRFFVVWPLICPYLAIPADAIVRAWKNQGARASCPLPEEI